MDRFYLLNCRLKIAIKLSVLCFLLVGCRIESDDEISTNLYIINNYDAFFTLIDEMYVFPDPDFNGDPETSASAVRSNDGRYIYNPLYIEGQYRSDGSVDRRRVSEREIYRHEIQECDQNYDLYINMADVETFQYMDSSGPHYSVNQGVFFLDDVYIACSASYTWLLSDFDLQALTPNGCISVTNNDEQKLSDARLSDVCEINSNDD